MSHCQRSTTGRQTADTGGKKEWVKWGWVRDRVGSEVVGEMDGEIEGDTVGRHYASACAHYHNQQAQTLGGQGDWVGSATPADSTGWKSSSAAGAIEAYPYRRSTPLHPYRRSTPLHTTTPTSTTTLRVLNYHHHTHNARHDFDAWIQ